MEAHFSQQLDGHFVFLYGTEVQRNIKSVSQRHCDGCAVAHLSQTKHSCIMWSSEEKLRVYFNVVVDSVVASDIAEQCSKDADTMPIPRGYLEMYKLKFSCEDWRNIEVSSSKWRQTLYEFTLRLIKSREQ